MRNVYTFNIFNKHQTGPSSQTQPVLNPVCIKPSLYRTQSVSNPVCIIINSHHITAKIHMSLSLSLSLSYRTLNLLTTFKKGFIWVNILTTTIE